MSSGRAIALALLGAATVGIAASRARAKPPPKRGGGSPPKSGDGHELDLHFPKMNVAELRELAVRAGFAGDAVDVAAAVAMAESGGNPDAIGDYQFGRSIGLWQVNLPSHPTLNEGSLHDPLFNAQAAFAISSGGKNWKPWTTFRTGAYLGWMP